LVRPSPGVRATLRRLAQETLGVPQFADEFLNKELRELIDDTKPKSRQ
jgi:hypothetical protein